MKKLFTLIATITLTAGLAQPTLIVEAPQNNASTSANRAPNGTTAHTYMRAGYLVLASELTNIPAATSISAFGFTLASGVSAPVTGNFTLYLENTTDVTYNKGTNWAGILPGMTQVYANVLSIPFSATSTSVMITLSTPFVYSGGGIYVAYDWFCPGPFSPTGAIYLCEATAMPLPAGGGCTGASATTPPTGLGLSNFRPGYLWEFTNPYTNDASVVGLEVPGRIPAMFNSPHVVRALVKNGSSGTLNNLPVTLNITGANPSNALVTISSLAPGATTLISFPPLNPQIAGLNNINVSVPPDQNVNNDDATYAQMVTCNEWAQNPATGTFTDQSVGFNTGSGIIANAYFNPVASTLVAVRGAVSTNTPSVGQQVYGVLLSSTGATLAVTPPVIITSTMLGTFQTFTFTTPQPLNAATNYFLGFAQTVGSVGYFPAGTQLTPHLPPNTYYSVGLAGGAPAVINQNFGYFGIEGIFTNTLTATIASSPTNVICGYPTTLTANSAATTFSWDTGPSTNSIVISPTVNTTYSLYLTGNAGCTNTITHQVNISPIPVSATVSSPVVCLGEAVSFGATGATTYSWNLGPSPTSASFTDAPVTTTVYLVTGTDPSGCTAQSGVVVSVISFTNLQTSASTMSTCYGNSISVTASGAVSYTWDTGTMQSNLPVFTETPTANGVYSLTGADANGCLMTTQFTVNVVSVPLSTSGDVAICSGQSANLQASGATTYSWSNFVFGPSNPVSPLTSTSYAVWGMDAVGCTSILPINVTVNPNPTVTATPDRTIMCVKESNEITASGAVSYVWEPAGTGAVFVITNPSQVATMHFTVTGTDANGCTHKVSTSVRVNACTDIRENGASAGISVFPNPGSGKFHIKSDVYPLKVAVYGGSGAQVMTTTVHQSADEIDLSDMAAGNYFIVVEGNERLRTPILIAR